MMYCQCLSSMSVPFGTALLWADGWKLAKESQMVILLQPSAFELVLLHWSANDRPWNWCPNRYYKMRIISFLYLLSCISCRTRSYSRRLNKRNQRRAWCRQKWHRNRVPSSWRHHPHRPSNIWFASTRCHVVQGQPANSIKQQSQLILIIVIVFII